MPFGSDLTAYRQATALSEVEHYGMFSITDIVASCLAQILPQMNHNVTEADRLFLAISGQMSKDRFPNYYSC